MFTVTITYFRYYDGANAREERNFVGKHNALQLFFQIYKAEDVKSIDLIDGETGEVLYCYRGGQFEVVESFLLR